jgi:8-oxo-dGTP diphosphatase
MEKSPKVGIGVVIYNDKNQILFIKRKGKHGDGEWSFPGGKLDFGESFEDCAKREVLEEVGIEISTPQYLNVTNDLFPDHDLHFITIFMKSNYISGEVRNLEPDKCSEVKWSTLDEVCKEPIFTPIINLLKL